MLDHTATIPAGMASRAESFVLYPPSNWIGDSGAFNWLIVGTDAHAKNYALFIGVQSRARLAPLYDVASILPYTQIDIKKTKLSIKLDGEYRFSNIQAATGTRWPRTSDSIRIRLSSARTNMLANCRITSQTLNAK
jgi:serine/threonine-protein kinase HipA